MADVILRVRLVGSSPPIMIDPDVAVVGSAMTLIGRGYGPAIDQHVEVIRFNFAKTSGYEKDVGKRETIRFWSLHWERLVQLYPKDKKEMEQDIIETTRDAQTLISYLHMVEISKKGEFYGRTDKVHSLSVDGKYFLKHHELKLDKPPRTGMCMIMALVSSGVVPHVYGFSTGTKGHKHPAHYFRKNAVVPTDGYHDVIQEEKIIEILAERGLIVLHECQVGGPPWMENRKTMVRELVKKGFVAVELGVDWGGFSNFILGNTKCAKLYSIDRWAGDRGHNEKQEAGARELLSKYGERSEVIKATFEEAIPRFKDESLDFVYIDGYAHTGQEGGKTLSDWWVKVRPGGIMAGHDYCAKWPKTQEAVNEFAEKNGLHISKTKDTNEDQSWWVTKP